MAIAECFCDNALPRFIAVTGMGRNKSSAIVLDYPKIIAVLAEGAFCLAETTE